MADKCGNPSNEIWLLWKLHDLGSRLLSHGGGGWIKCIHVCLEYVAHLFWIQVLTTVQEAADCR